MLRTITPAEMKRVETRVMRETGITGEQLMHRAASHVARAVLRRVAGRKGRVLCLCGTGNNGGDGLAAMRILMEADPAFAGECWIMPGELSADARRERDCLVRAAGQASPRVAVRRLEEGARAELPADLACVVDALFGTGLSRPVEGLARALCGALGGIRGAGVPVVAVDIPSGLNGETGQVMGAAARASETVTFHRPKPGLFLGEGPNYTGKLTVADIGLADPEAAALDDADGFFVLEKSDLGQMLPARERVSHKGSYGRVLLWAGSRGMAGAAAVSAMGALRAGAGLVTVACPDQALDVVQTLCPCATCVPLPMDDVAAAWSELEGALERADALGAGCGLGQNGRTAALLERLLGYLGTHAIPAVLDADALNLLAKSPARLCGGGARILTPHPAEAARLLGASTREVIADAPGSARRLAERYGAAVALKGAASVLCEGDRMALNPFGTPAMAKGGSGDALTGVLAALLSGRAAGAYAMDDLALMQAACALHGLAGERAEERFGPRGVLATDLCMFLGLDYAAEKETGQTEREAARTACASPLGRVVNITVEHKRGMRDPKRHGLVYELNCGYVQECLDEQNVWQDACVLGTEAPLEWFEGEVAARLFTARGEIWVAAPKGMRPTAEEVRQATAFLGRAERIEVR